jgi:hypothetical protein
VDTYHLHSYMYLQYISSSFQSQSYATTHGQSAQDQIVVTVRQLRVCRHGMPSLTRGRVCHLQLLLALASTVILESESGRTHDNISLSQVQDSPNLEGQVPVFTTSSNRVAQLYREALGSLFIIPYDSQFLVCPVGPHYIGSAWNT